MKQKELYKQSKKLLRKTSDPFKALLANRSKPLAKGHSPAELSMGRSLRTGLPMLPSLLTPKLPDVNSLNPVYVLAQKNATRDTELDLCH